MRQRARSYGRAPEMVVEPETSAFPKRKPEGEPVDYTSLAIPKSAPDRSRSFLDMVRGEICAVNHVAHSECGGVTEAAHLETAGKAIKASDYLTVPLCTVHHRAQHNAGMGTFQVTYGVNLWQVNAHIQARFIRSLVKR